jgi:hypothetical protein
MPSASALASPEPPELLAVDSVELAAVVLADDALDAVDAADDPAALDADVEPSLEAVELSLVAAGLAVVALSPDPLAELLPQAAKLTAPASATTRSRRVANVRVIMVMVLCSRLFDVTCWGEPMSMLDT